MNIHRTITLLALTTIAGLSQTAIASASINQIGSFGTTGPGALRGAEGIAVNPKTNDVYVADKLDHRVVEYDQNGNFILTFGREVNETKVIEKQKGASITEAEENICTAASTDTCTDGLAGSAAGQLDWPTGVAVDSNTGDVYVSDGGNERIERYTAQGEYVSQIISGQNGAPDFVIGVYYNVYANDTIEFTSEGNDSWVDAEGNLYLRSIPEPFVGWVYKFDPTGAYTGEAFTPEARGGGWKGGPAAVVVDAGGTVYASERQIQTNNNIVKFKSDGELLGQLGPGKENADPCIPSWGYALAVNLFTGEVFNVGKSKECEPITRVYSPSGQVVAELPALDEPSHESHEGEYHPYVYQALAYGTAVGKLYQLSGGGEKVEVVVYGTFALPPQSAPTVVGEDWSGIGLTSVTLGAQVTPNLVDTTYQIEYGTDPGLAGASSMPVSPADAGSGFLPVNVSQQLSGLLQSTTYYYRVVAHSSFGGGAGSTVDGAIQSFTTLAPPPSVTTVGASEISSNTASMHGSVIPGSTGAASDTKWCFQYGSTEAPGYNLGFAPGAPTGDAGQGIGGVPVSVRLTHLMASTTYRYRLVAVNSLGSRLSSTACNTEGGHETDGTEGTFTTSSAGPEPIAVSGPVVGVAQNAATLTGTVDPLGVRTVYYFQIGTDSNYGVDLFGPAGAGSEPEAVSVLASSLQPGTTYHYRLVASNANGTSYGADESFTTPAFPSSVLSAPPTSSLLAVPAIVFPSEPVVSKTKAKTKKTKKRKKSKPKKGNDRKSSVRKRGHRTSMQ